MRKFIFLALGLVALQTDASTQNLESDPTAQNWGVFDWIPDGRRPRELPENCSADELHRIITHNNDTGARSAKILDFFGRCEKYHTLLGESDIRALLQLFNIDYEYQNVPFIKPLKLTMRDGAVLHALLAMKPDSHPRPLVIVQCGLTCTTVGSPSVRWPLMHLFDESPFHVLIVGSSTTAEFGITNRKFYTGGIQEGLYINEIAKWLKTKSEISDLISSIHVQGMSLGGHGALYSALYSQEVENENLIRSTQAYCPVVELKPAMDNIMLNTPPGRFLQGKIWSQMQQMLGQVPVIDRMIPNGKKPSSERMKEIVAQASLEYFGTSTLLTGLLRKIFYILVSFPTTIDDYWKSNRFSTLVQGLRSPVIIWSADDDPAVLPSENSLVLLEHANRPGSTLTVLNTGRGSHCGFALSHGWDIYSTLMKSYILAYSPEFLEKYHEHRRPLSRVQTGSVVLLPGQRHFSQSFELDTGKDTIKVTYQIFDSHKKKCGNIDPYLATDTRCFTTETTKIHISDLHENMIFTPQNDAIAQMLTRWANANLRILDARGRRLIDSNQEPAIISWNELDH